MAFDNPAIEEYIWTDATFGATSVTHQLLGPRGKVGFVRDIIVDVATTLVGTTTVPEIDVGFASGDFTYGRYRLGKTAIAGYPVGAHRASDENWTGNPPRTLADYTGHVVLDGGPYGASPQNIVGGSSSTQQPLGRIPYAFRKVQNVVNGTGNVVRIYLDDVSGLVATGTVLVQGIAGATATLTVGDLTVGTNAISAVSSPAYGPGYIELTGTTFAGTYTSGGIVSPITFVTCTAGTGGVPAGGGTVKVIIEWVGAVTP